MCEIGGADNNIPFNEIENGCNDREEVVRELEQRCAHLSAELAAEKQNGTQEEVQYHNICVLCWGQILVIKPGRSLSRQEYISPSSRTRTHILFDTGANLNCLDFDLLQALLNPCLVREHKYVSQHKCLNGTGNGSASIVGWAVVIIAFEGANFPVSCDIVINLGLAGIIGCNFMGQTKPLC